MVDSALGVYRVGPFLFGLVQMVNLHRAKTGCVFSSHCFDSSWDRRNPGEEVCHASDLC